MKACIWHAGRDSERSTGERDSAAARSIETDQQPRGATNATTFPPSLRHARSSPSEVYSIQGFGEYAEVMVAVFTARELVCMLCGEFPPWEEFIARWVATTAHWDLQRLRAAERARMIRFRM